MYSVSNVAKKIGSSKAPKKRSNAQNLRSKSLTQKENVVLPPVAKTLVQSANKSAAQTPIDHCHELEKAKRKIRHLDTKNKKLEQTVIHLKTAAKTQECEHHKARLAQAAGLAQAAASQAIAADMLSKATGKVAAMTSTNLELKNTVWALQRWVDCSTGVLS
ncbi:hypothetical protein B0H10DRAFT_1938233 [Mycena sp. CBHHK59/15]|nr:hypothetical protein B0H10DRAFT_1938233 [Mycena sp. CBHHK59/15]